MKVFLRLQRTVVCLPHVSFDYFYEKVLELLFTYVSIYASDVFEKSLGYYISITWLERTVEKTGVVQKFFSDFF